MIRAIDNWVMTRLDSLIAWLWYRHEIKKIDVLRMLMIISGGCALGTAILHPWFVLACIGIFVVWGLNQLRAEVLNRTSAKFQNQIVLGNRNRLYWLRVFGPLWMTAWSIFPPYSNNALLNAIGLIGLAVWLLFDDTFVPDGPTKRRKRAKVTYGQLLPAFVKS